jgi:hypothetical protein
MILLPGFNFQSADEFSVEPIQAGGETCGLRSIDLLIVRIWNKEDLPDQWKDSISVPI